MPESLTGAEQLRCVALDAASRATPLVDPQSGRRVPTSGVIGTAAQFETWLVTGICPMTPYAGSQVGTDGVSVLVHGPAVDGDLLAAVRETVRRWAA